MTAPWDDWDHILKVDPDKSLVGDETYDDVCRTGTDAIEIGGTLDVTAEKTRRVIEACRKHDVPLYQEPSNPAVVVEDEGLDGYLVPIVLNAGDPFWITGAHKEWVRIAHLDWERTGTEAYIVLNPDASVAGYTEADCDLDTDEVAAYARVAERMLGQDIVYLEYSGMLGDPDVVEETQATMNDAALFYGGGIGSYDDAYTLGEHADTIIVGDLVHAEGVDAVQRTVEGVRDAHK